MPLPKSPYPVCVVEFDGQAVYSYDVRSLDLETNVGFLADALTLVLDNSRLVSDFIRKEQAVEVWLGYVGDPHLWDKSELVHIFSGAVDGVAPSFGTDRTLTVRCRDHTRLLIDSQADPGWSYASLADAGIVTLLAQQVGLVPRVSPSQVPISEEEQQAFLGGGYIGNPEVGMSGWEIVQTLAVRNGYVAYVTPDKVLYWGPRGSGWRAIPGLFGVQAPTVEPVLGTWTYLEEPHDLLGASFDDSALVVNKVTVVRWLGLDEVQPDGFVSGFAVDAGRVTAARGRIVEKTVASTTANSTQECEAEARALLATLVRPAITAQATVEGDPRLVGEAKLTLAGKALGRFAADYYIEAARHHFGTDGYRTELQLSSVRPEASEVYRSALNVSQEDAEDSRAQANDAGGAPSPSQGPRGVFFPVVTEGDPSVGAIEWTGAPGTSHFVSGHPEAGAMDIFAAIGAPIYAPVDGTVVYASTSDPLGGNNAVLRGADGQWYYFAHGNVAFTRGDWRAGQRVGEVGKTGSAQFTAPHLHFAISDANNFDVLAGKGNVRFGHEYWVQKGSAAAQGASAAATGGTRGALARAPSSVQAVIRAGGWPEAQWDNAAAIVERETGGTWNPHSLNPNGEYSIGLFQVNVVKEAWHDDVCRFLGLPTTTSNEALVPYLWDPLTNSQVAYHVVYLHGGWHWWTTAAPLGLS